MYLQALWKSATGPYLLSHLSRGVTGEVHHVNPLVAGIEASRGRAEIALTQGEREAG